MGFLTGSSCFLQTPISQFLPLSSSYSHIKNVKNFNNKKQRAMVVVSHLGENQEEEVDYCRKRAILVLGISALPFFQLKARAAEETLVKDFDDAECLRERLVREPLELLKLRELTVAERVKKFHRFKSFFTKKLCLEEKSITSRLARKHSRRPGSKHMAGPEAIQTVFGGAVGSTSQPKRKALPAASSDLPLSKKQSTPARPPPMDVSESLPMSPVVVNREAPSKVLLVRGTGVIPSEVGYDATGLYAPKFICGEPGGPVLNGMTALDCPEVAQCLMQGNVLEKDRLKLSEKYKAKHASDLLKKQYQLRYKLNLVSSMTEEKVDARLTELTHRCNLLEREADHHKTTAARYLEKLERVHSSFEAERKVHAEEHGKLMVAIQEKDVVQAHLDACKKELAMEMEGRRVAEEAVANLNGDLAAWKSGYDTLVGVKDACELTLHRHVRVCEPFFATVFPGQTMDQYMAMVNALKGGDLVVRADTAVATAAEDVAPEVADEAEASQRDESLVEQVITDPVSATIASEAPVLPSPDGQPLAVDNVTQQPLADASLAK